MNTNFIESVRYLDSGTPVGTKLVDCLYFQHSGDLGNWFAFQVKVPQQQTSDYLMYLEVYGLNPNRKFVKKGAGVYPQLEDDIVITTALEPSSEGDKAGKTLHVYQLDLNIDPGHEDAEWVYFLKNKPQEKDPKVEHRYVFVKSNKTIGSIPW